MPWLTVVIVAQEMVSEVRVDYFLRMREKENQGGHQGFWSKQLADDVTY